jgi:hypothetical protein
MDDHSAQLLSSKYAQLLRKVIGVVVLCLAFIVYIPKSADLLGYIYLDRLILARWKKHHKFLLQDKHVFIVELQAHHQLVVI